MKKKQLFLAVQAALFTFAVGNVTAVEDTAVESMPVVDETVDTLNVNVEPVVEETTNDFVDEPSVEEATDETPVAEETSEEAPVVEETSEEEPVAEETSEEEPVILETIAVSEENVDVTEINGTAIEGYILDSEGNPLSNVIVTVSAITTVTIESVVEDDDAGSNKDSCSDDDAGSKAKDDDDSGSKAKDDDDSGSKAKDDDDSGSNKDSCSDDDSNADDGVIMVRTDENGFYQITGLDVGVYGVSVSQEIELGETGNFALIEIGSFTVQINEQGSYQVPEFEIPLVNELPEGESLEDVTVVGDPEEPIVIENREVHGTVRLSFTTIVNINVGMNANLILGRGVHFRHHSAIPFGLRLTNIFRPIMPAVVVTGVVRQEVAAVDLSESVVEDAPPVLEDIAEVLNEGTGEENTIAQDPETGHLEVSIDDVDYAVVPTEVVQAEEDEVPGVQLNGVDGSIVFITHKRQKVITYAAVQSMTDFVSGLADIGLFRLAVDKHGRLSAINPNTRVRYSGRSDFLSESVDESTSEGVYSILGSDFVRFVFKGKAKRRQVIYPAPVDLDVLISENVNVENVEVQSTGIVSFNLQGFSHQGILSYDVVSGEVPASGGAEFVAEEDGNFTIIYPNGDRQVLLITQ